MIDKDFCLSSYIAFRYIFKNNIDFFEGFKHENFKPTPINERVSVKAAQEIDDAIQKQFDELYEKYDKIGILLSGGMDSAIVASYLKPGSNAYTFSNDDSDVYDLEKQRSIRYCKKFNLNQHFVDIDFEDYEKFTPKVMENKHAPVHSIEPQIYKAALQAKANGDELIVVGESADLIFGGMDQLISKDWEFDDFVKRYTFLEPESVLTNPVNVNELYEKYRLPGNKIDFLRFMEEVFSIESSGSYLNAFRTANLEYYDPYAILVMEDELDLKRVRNGEPKYLIRELFSIKYPEFEIPDKIPMPRPVDFVFKDWDGPKREEFRDDIDMNKLTGNQKWQLWCAELFLNIHDP